MNCPKCHRAMSATPVFLTVDYVCRSCELGEKPREIVGHVILDAGIARCLEKQALRLMVFKSPHAAISAALKMGACAVREVHFCVEPAWHPRKLRPEDMVVWCDVRWERESGRLVGGMERRA